MIVNEIAEQRIQVHMVLSPIAMCRTISRKFIIWTYFRKGVIRSASSATTKADPANISRAVQKS
jgi:hypothetical protein